MPQFLKKCVESGVIDDQVAQRIDQFRRRSGVGLVESMRQMGLLPQESDFEGLVGLESVERPYVPLLFPVPPNPLMTFETYISCERNAFPLEVAASLSRSPDKRATYSPLYIYSPIGLGKTHVLSGVANTVGEGKALLVNMADLQAEHERATRLRARAEFRGFLIKPEMLLIDDIQLCEGDEVLQRELFAVLSHVVRVGHTAVITSDVPPTRLRGVESRLLSRLKGGVIVGLQIPEKARRKEILRQVPGCDELNDDVVDFLADNVKDSVRSLIASARQLLALTVAAGMPADIDVARTVIPKPDDFYPLPARAPDPVADANPTPMLESKVEKAARFKKMLDEATNEEEQALALQIAIGERLRDLREEGGDADAVRRLQNALNLLRDGKMEEAMRCMRL